MTALSLPGISKFRLRAFRWCMTYKADVIDDVTKQMGLIAFFLLFSSVPPTQTSTYDKKLGMKMIARTRQIFWNTNWKKCWFSTKKFSKSPLVKFYILRVFGFSELISGHSHFFVFWEWFVSIRNECRNNFRYLRSLIGPFSTWDSRKALDETLIFHSQ